jgi:chemotaxis methyl-accepting protein methylase/signal transduction histidine kinase/chemotaxis response regulator CheB
MKSKPTPKKKAPSKSASAKAKGAGKAKPAKAPQVVPVVGVGASAGGLEALQTFFDHMPGSSGLAFVVVQHLSPDYKSLMVELLSKNTSMDVKRIEDGMPVAPNTIYLIPPKKNVRLFHDHLMLTDPEVGHGLNLPIDVFFRSLADHRGEQSVGIVLSGTGSDGTRGIRAIKESGGMVMVQDPATSKFDGMPVSAIGTGLADYVLPADELPQQLLNFVQHPLIQRSPDDADSLGADEDTLVRILGMLGAQTGVDFTLYKPSTVVRRIERRMGINQLQTLADYVQYLQQSPREVTALYKDLLIGVTKFFRDTEAFALLESKVLPELLAKHADTKTVRIWVAGCSTGEEAYSIAILVRELVARLGKPYDVKIFATDIDREAIEVASAGSYPPNISAEVSEERLRAFFTERNGFFQVNRDIREMVVFAPQNLLKDPPFTKMDLVSCRNMLIYLQPALQRRILSLFSFALQEGGYLLLGSSETVGDLSQIFEAVDAKWKLFARQPGATLAPESALLLPPGRERLLRSHFTPPLLRAAAAPPRSVEDGLIQDVQARLIAEYAPFCMVVDETGNLMHSFGAAPAFLRLPPGRVSLSLSRLLPKELSLAFSTAQHRVLKERAPVVYHNVRLGGAEDPVGYNLRVEPLPVNADRQLLLLVHLTPVDNAVPDDDSPQRSYDCQKDQNQRIADLELELQMTRENLQATVEELETSNEELQATNEELLAANEELQSTNEELQSVNEELYTVNAEYQSKIGELTELNADMDNLLSSSEIGTLFLDGQLRIRKFTNAIGRELNLLPHDVGRPASDLGHPLLKESVADFQAALRDESHDRTVRTFSGKWMLMRILPYRSGGNGPPQGVVLTMVNVTPLKEAEESLRTAQTSVEDRVQMRTAELERARIAAEAANLAKNEFLSNTTSEIRAPLNAALGCIELAMESPLSDEQKTLLSTARSRSLDLLHMLNNVVDLSRMEANRLGLIIEEYNLRGVVAEALASVVSMAEKKHIELAHDVDPDLPDVVRGDAPRLRQILFNLLSNAVKFTESGRVSVEVRAGDDPASPQLHFVVRDTGIGIPPEHLHSIFDPFRQVDGGLDRRFGGAGLGLAVSHRLLEKMGGRIWVDSVPGKGSEFHFSIPLGSARKDAAAAADATPPAALRILLVDDDSDCRMITAAHLRALGHAYAEAEDARQCIERLRADAFDVVLLDVEMPGTSGFDLAKLIRSDVGALDAKGRHICDVPLVAVTSHTTAADRLASRAAGMDAFVEKPLGRASLAQALKSVGGRRHE